MIVSLAKSAPPTGMTPAINGFYMALLLTKDFLKELP